MVKNADQVPTRRKKVQHFDEPGDAHFLTFACYRRMALLSKDRTRLWLMRRIDLGRVPPSGRFQPHPHCLPAAGRKSSGRQRASSGTRCMGLVDQGHPCVSYKSIPVLRIIQHNVQGFIVSSLRDDTIKPCTLDAKMRR